MAKKPKAPELPPLELGAEVMVILDEVSGRRSRSGDRRTVIGAGRGLVSEIGADETYKVKLTMAKPDYMIGREIEKKRGRMYWTGSKAERVAFTEIVNLFWGRNER